MIWFPNLAASSIVAPYTTRSSPAHKQHAMHIGQGSHVVYSVYPFSKAFSSFAHARRMVTISPCALGSCCAPTAFNARINSSPLVVSKIAAPYTVGCGVSKLNAVQSASDRILAASTLVPAAVGAVGAASARCASASIGAVAISDAVLRKARRDRGRAIAIASESKFEPSNVTVRLQ